MLREINTRLASKNAASTRPLLILYKNTRTLLKMECFICTETQPPPPKSPCDCKDRHIHTHCLMQMLSTRTNNACPVCTASYRTVKKIEISRCRFDRNKTLMWALTISIFVMMTCMVNSIAHLVYRKPCEEYTLDNKTCSALATSSVVFGFCSIVMTCGWLYAIKINGMQILQRSCFVVVQEMVVYDEGV